MCLLINTNIELLLGNEVTWELYDLFTMRWASTNSQLPRNTRKVKVRSQSCSEKSTCFKENLNGRTIQKSNIALRVITSSFKHFPKDWRKIHTLKV